MTSRTGPVTVARTELRLLGPPQIVADGRGVGVDTRKAIALAAYLALEGRTLSRDHLATLLWPEADQSRARSALRRTLSALNAALGGRGLVIERESLRFRPGEVWVDVLAFREAAASDDPAEWIAAADLASSGELLAGFVLRDSPAFDDWQLAAADDVRRELGVVLERLADPAVTPDVERAIGFAKRWIDLDPLHEAAHRTLMRLFAAAGDRAAALRQYRACVACLDRELGVEPLPETTELYESIRESRPVQPLEQPTEAVPVQDLPFVGRDAEVSVVTDAFAAVRTSGRLVAIAGEAGIGKTRLATEALAGLRERAVVIEARAHPEEERLAFGTCVELLRAIPQERLASVPAGALAETARLVPELSEPELSEKVPVRTPADPPGARRRLLEAVADVLAAAADVIFVDDAQWADGSSRDVIRFLVRRLERRGCLVVLAWRSEEVHAGHPLHRMLADGKRSRLATEIVLDRLTEDDVAALAASVDASDEVRGALFDQTAGVPFFVAEYLRADVRSEHLPAGIRDLFASRIERVGGGAAQVLAAASILGRAFDPRTVRSTSGRTEAEVASALDELSSAGLVMERDERYDFTHPKLREYVYGTLTTGRRRILHARAAKATLRDARRHPEQTALAAYHLERAGDEETAAATFALAGDHARSVYANAEALSHYRSALGLGHLQAASLHESIGDLLTLGGAYADAITSYEKAAALGANIEVVGHKLGGVHQRLGDRTSAEAHYLEAAEALGGGPGLARLLADRSLNAHRANLSDEASALAADALDVAQRERDPRALAQAHNINGILATSRGARRAAREHLSASLEIAEEVGDLAAAAAALNNLALTLRGEGAFDLALSSAERALEICRKIGDRHREAAVLSNTADILRDLGRGEEALDHVKRSVAILTEIDEVGEPQPEIWKLTEW